MNSFDNNHVPQFRQKSEFCKNPGDSCFDWSISKFSSAISFVFFSQALLCHEDNLRYGLNIAKLEVFEGKARAYFVRGLQAPFFRHPPLDPACPLF